MKKLIFTNSGVYTVDIEEKSSTIPFLYGVCVGLLISVVLSVILLLVF